MTPFASLVLKAVLGIKVLNLDKLGAGRFLEPGAVVFGIVMIFTETASTIATVVSF